MSDLLNQLPPNIRELLVSIGFILVAVLAGIILHFMFWHLLRGFARRTSGILDDSLVKHCRKPTAVIIPILTTFIVLPLLGNKISGDLVVLINRLLTMMLTFSIAWTMVRLTSVAEDVILDRFDISASDNRKARRIQTQFQIVRKIVVVIISVAVRYVKNWLHSSSRNVLSSCQDCERNSNLYLMAQTSHHRHDKFNILIL